MKECRTCGKELYPRNVTGYCRKCKNSSPEHRASVSKKMKHRWNFDPEARAKMTAAGIKNLNGPGVREKAAEATKKNRTWEIATKAITAEDRARGARRGSATKLSHIPREYHDHYRYLTRSKGMRAAEAVLLIQEQYRSDMARFIRKIKGT